MKAIHDNNFWEINSELILLPELEELYTSDKSKNKSESSVTMWAVYYAYNPDSKFFNLPTKLEVLKNNFIKRKEFTWESIDVIVTAYKNLVLTDSERALVNWGEIMTMRDKSLKKLYQDLLNVSIAELDTKSLKEVDTMLSNTPKMFEDFKKIRKDYEEEKTLKKGKKNRSLSDSGEI